MNAGSFSSTRKQSALSAILVFFCVLAGFCLLPPKSLSAATQSSTRQEKLYTQEQANRGKVLYAKECASCHGQSLEGIPATALAGERFMAKWGQGKHTIDDLYYITRTTMPYETPDSLTAQQYIDIVAYILASNGYQAGPRALPADPKILRQSKIAPPALIRRDRGAA